MGGGWAVGWMGGWVGGEPESFSCQTQVLSSVVVELGLLLFIMLQCRLLVIALYCTYL